MSRRKPISNQILEASKQFNAEIFVETVKGSFSDYEKSELKNKVWELRWKDGRRIYYAYIPEKKIFIAVRR